MPRLGLVPYLTAVSDLHSFTWDTPHLIIQLSKTQAMCAVSKSQTPKRTQVLSLHKRLMFRSAVFHLGCGSCRFLFKVGPATELFLHTAETATTSSPLVVLSLHLPSSLTMHNSMPLTLHLHIFSLYLNQHCAVLVASSQTGCSALILSMVWQDVTRL